MSKFTPSDFQVKTDKQALPDVRVVKVESHLERVVESYQFGPIARAGTGDYAATREKYGSLAVTDADRSTRNQKDRRFSLNPLLRDPLSVEQEERRAIEVMVQGRVQAIEEEVRLRAQAEGYQAGLDQGHAEAFKKFQDEGESRLSQLDSLLSEIDGAKTQIFEANERFLIDLVFKVSKMVMLKELSTDRDYLIRLCKELIERIGVREGIRVKINPNEAASIGMLRDGLEKSLGTLKNLNIETSPQIGIGGCSVETEWNAIDASIDTQLKAIQSALVGDGNLS